jgi:hypothetical protein
MEINISENGVMITKMAMVFYIMQMDLNMKDSFKIISCREMAKWNISKKIILI